MTAEEKIIRYLTDISKGFIKLKPNQASVIINLVLNHSEKVVIVQKFKYNGANSCYDPFFTKIVSFDIAKAVVDKHKGTTQFRCFYLYRISELNFEYYSVNPNLF